MGKIESHSIFGNYSQTENKVTAALLQILKAGGTEFIAKVISEIDEIDFPSSEIKIVTQERENHNVYDGLLECDFSFRVLVECKIKLESVNITQLAGLIDNAQGTTDYILYITPDNKKPNELCDNSKIYWSNWSRINEILKETNPKTEPINFLINEFEKFLEFLELLEISEQRVQIAAGSWGEPIALEYGFYACQNNRTRKESKYLAFYNQGGIHTLFEIIGEPQNDYDLSKSEDEIIKKYLEIADPNYIHGSFRQFYQLKLISDELNIKHLGKNKNGKGSAYTMGVFRYTTIEKIEKAKTTDDL